MKTQLVYSTGKLSQCEPPIITTAETYYFANIAIAKRRLKQGKPYEAKLRATVALLHASNQIDQSHAESVLSHAKNKLNAYLTVNA